MLKSVLIFILLNVASSKNNLSQEVHIGGYSLVTPNLNINSFSLLFGNNKKLSKYKNIMEVQINSPTTLIGNHDILNWGISCGEYQIPDPASSCSYNEVTYNLI